MIGGSWIGGGAWHKELGGTGGEAAGAPAPWLMAAVTRVRQAPVASVGDAPRVPGPMAELRRV